MKNAYIRICKIIIGISLGLTGVFTGSVLTMPQPASAAAAATLATEIISTGEDFIGTPYQYGADEDQTRTFDCSSFTQYVYKLYGITLPRSSKQQSQSGSYVPRSQLKPGDLVFFYSPIHHVAIYIGNGQILHTYGKPGVTISNLDSGWWDTHYTTARRVLP